MTNFKKLLLTSAAVVALGAFAGHAHADDEEATGTAAAPNALNALADGEDIVNIVDDQASAVDAAGLNIDNGEQITDFTIDTDALIGLYDGTNDTASGDTLTATGNADINSGATLTILFGGDEADGAGNDGAEEGNLIIQGNIGDTPGTTLTRGGTLAILGAANEAGGEGSDFTAQGNVLMTGVSVTGGAGGAAEAGSGVTGTFGDAITDTFDVTTLTVLGGAGDAAGARNGGGATATVVGAATIGGATTVTGGSDGAGGGNGGAAALTFQEDVTSSSTLAIVGGATAGAGTAGNASVTLQDNATFTGITLNDEEGTATLTADSETTTAGSFTVTGTIDSAGTADEGTVVVVDSDTTNTGTVTFASAIGGTAATTRVANVEIGSNAGDTGGGIAVFNGTVNANVVRVGSATMNDQSATATFNSGVTAVTDLFITAEATGAGTDPTQATFKGDVTSADITLDDGAGGNEATMTVDGTSAQTVTGPIDAATAGEGNLVIGSTGSNSNVTLANTTIVGGAAALDLVQVVSGSTLNISNNVTTNAADDTTVGVDIDGTLNIAADDNTVTVSTDANGDVDIDGTVSITGDNAVTIDGDSDLFIDGTFATALTATATTTLAANAGAGNTTVGATSATTITAGNQIVLTGDLAVSGNAGNAVTLEINKTAAFDPTATTVVDAAADTVDIDSDGSLRVTLAATSEEFDSGDTITVIDSDEAVELDNVDTNYGALITSGDVVLVDTALLALSDNSSTANDLLITVTAKDAASVFDRNTYAGAANSLLALASASTSGNLETIRGNLQGAASATAAEEIAESISPTVDGGATSVAITNVTNSAAGLTGDRLASLRTGSETGMAAGNLTHGLKVWGQVFGTTGEQDGRDGIDGYDVDTFGVTVGIDTQTLAEDWVWGLAFTYADTEVDSNNANNTNAEIDTFQIALYADYKWDEMTYINGTIGYGLNDTDQTRSNVGLIGATANADYDTDQFFARLETGRDYEFDGGTTLTPFALMNFSYADTDSYTETGAGTANLNVETDENYIFEIGLGAEASWLHEMDDGSYLKPKLRAGYRYDIADDEVETTSTFTGGGAAFTTEGFDPQQHTFNVGAGLTFYTTANWELTANYDFEIKEDYDAHNGYLRAAYRF